MTSVTIVGVLMLLSGFALRLLVSKNRFDRRGPAGLQQFESYWKALFATVAEWLLGIIGFVLIVAGAVLLLVHWYNHY